FEIHSGDHYGYSGPKPNDKRPLGYDPPLCWIPRRQDNSCGGQCWADTDHWGPLSGLMLHFSFGQCTMLPVLREVIDGVAQGASEEYRDVKKWVVGRDDVDLVSATVLDDGKTLFLELDDFRPAMQYAITGQIANASGTSTALAVYPTIHRTHAEMIDEGRLVR